jgi:hypothetical protein
MARRKNTTVFDSLHQALNGIQGLTDDLETIINALKQLKSWYLSKKEEEK